MEEIVTPYGEIDISYDWKDFYRKEVDKIIGNSLKISAEKSGQNVNELIDERVNAVLQLSLERTIELLSKKGFSKPKKVRMLTAHGHSQNDPKDSYYIYYDVKPDGSRTVHDVQDWVIRHDGNYGALFVEACNPAGLELSVKKSVLIYPGEDHNGKEIIYASYGVPSEVLRIKSPKIL